MKEINSIFQSQKIDIHSETWKFLDQWLQGKLVTLRDRNENKSLDMIKTSVVRGEIRVIKEILTLPEGR